MSRLALLALALALALSGCNTGGGYYAPGVDLGLHGREVLCDLPKTAKFARSFAFTNNAQACRDLGGKPLK